jgi:predicted nuclease of predicted toxin-antitoxin system
VKLLFDQNMPPRLVDSLASLYPDSRHVFTIGLDRADDWEIWAYAKANGLTIASKDSDYLRLSILLGAPPKVVWVGLGNCSVKQLEDLLRNHHETIAQFVKSPERTYLMLR